MKVNKAPDNNQYQYHHHHHHYHKNIIIIIIIIVTNIVIIIITSIIISNYLNESRLSSTAFLNVEHNLFLSSSSKYSVISVG
jgi:hypothetical protein